MGSHLSVSLPMYDWPEVQAHTDKFWTTLRLALLDHGFGNLPAKLTRTSRIANGHVGLTQSCGFPLKHELGSSVEILGTPTYTVDYCKDGLYASVILIHQSDLRINFSDFQTARPVVNALNSQSGCNALRNFTNDMELSDTQCFFVEPLISGSHRQSITLVAQQKADLCAIDPVSWHLAQCFHKEASQLRVLCHTRYTPALPLICSSAIAQGFSGSLGSGPDALRKTVVRAWQEAISHDSVTAKKLFLKGITTIERDAYLAVPTLD